MASFIRLSRNDLSVLSVRPHAGSQFTDALALLHDYVARASSSPTHVRYTDHTRVAEALRAGPALYFTNARERSRDDTERALYARVAECIAANLDVAARLAFEPTAAERSATREIADGYQAQLLDEYHSLATLRAERRRDPRVSPHLGVSIDSIEDVVYERVRSRGPLVEIALELNTQADDAKTVAALRALADEGDRSLTMRRDVRDRRSLILGAMDEQHLANVIFRVTREFQVEARLGRIRVAYRESVRARVERHSATLERQSAGRGEYAHVVINVEPATGAGFVFESKIVGGALPREYIDAVREGILETAALGVVAGYPVIDVRVELVDGSYHDVDSSESTFRRTGAAAFAEAVKRAEPVVLEPVMSVEVTTPEESLADVLGDLAARRATIQETSPRGDEYTVIAAIAPLAELLGYAAALHAITQDRGSYSMEFRGFEAAPMVPVTDAVLRSET